MYRFARMQKSRSVCAQVVILDDHADQVLDGFWAAAVAGGGGRSLESPWNATSAGTLTARPTNIHKHPAKIKRWKANNQGYTHSASNNYI